MVQQALQNGTNFQWIQFNTSFNVYFECLRFHLRLSLSVNSWMTCVWPNYHIAVQNLCTFFIENANFIRHFKIKIIYIFECEWPNGNLNNLCMAKLPFGHSHSNSNANRNWGIQNAPAYQLYPVVSHVPCMGGEYPPGASVPTWGVNTYPLYIPTPGGANFHSQPPLWTYRHLWKHYLPATSFAGGNYWKRCFAILDVIISIVLDYLQFVGF